MRNANPTFFRLFTHLMRWALALALASAGRSIPARIAMIAMTTNSSMSVKAPTLYLRNTLFMIVLSVIGLRFAHSKQTLSSVNAFSETFLAMQAPLRDALKTRVFRRGEQLFEAARCGIFTRIA